MVRLITLLARAKACGLTLLALTSLAALFYVTPVPLVSAQDEGRSATAAKAPADAGGDKDDGDDEDDDARFAQTVRVADLIDRDVIAPLESHDLLGRVKKLVRDGDGDVLVVMSYGGHFGFGSHLICVALDDLALTGRLIQAKDVDADDLNTSPTCDGSGDGPIAPNAMVKMKLAKPPH